MQKKFYGSRARTLFKSGTRYASLVLHLLSAKYFQAHLTILLSLSRNLSQNQEEKEQKRGGERRKRRISFSSFLDAPKAQRKSSAKVSLGFAFPSVYGSSITGPAAPATPSNRTQEIEPIGNRNRSENKCYGFNPRKVQEEAQLEAHNLLLSNSTKLQDEAQSEAQSLMSNSPKLQDEAKPEAKSGAQLELRLRSRDDSRYMPQLLLASESSSPYLESERLVR
jgi:hypothetical protein